jgi:hypothetical protein
MDDGHRRGGGGGGWFIEPEHRREVFAEPPDLAEAERGGSLLPAAAAAATTACPCPCPCPCPDVPLEEVHTELVDGLERHAHAHARVNVLNPHAWDVDTVRPHVTDTCSTRRRHPRLGLGLRRRRWRRGGVARGGRAGSERRAFGVLVLVLVLVRLVLPRLRLRLRWGPSELLGLVLTDREDDCAEDEAVAGEARCTRTCHPVFLRDSRRRGLNGAEGLRLRLRLRFRWFWPCWLGWLCWLCWFCYLLGGHLACVLFFDRFRDFRDLRDRRARAQVCRVRRVRGGLGTSA